MRFNNYYHGLEITEQKFNELESIKHKFGWDKENVWDEPIFFPWIHVLDAKLIDNDITKNIEGKDCPICKCQSNIQWTYFISPKSTWNNLCGRAGYLSVCTTCERQVYFKLVAIN